MARGPSNVAASVRQRLLNLSRATGQPFDLVLTRYVLERLLYRLGRSAHRDRFVLKGAMLLTTWLGHTDRGTRDLDLLAYGDPGEGRVAGVLREILNTEVKDDGVVFDPEAFRLEAIREDAHYGGLRMRSFAMLAGARVPVIVDIAFGDAVAPGLEEIEYPVLLDQPKPRLLAYAPETVVAEKLQAMVVLGRANTRMKDFYDVWSLSRRAADQARLTEALRATFERRRTLLPEALPDALSEAFGSDPAKRRQWSAFAADIGDAPADLAVVVADIAAFAWPMITAARTFS
ncbi:MAG: nucleotidyl transferase AbiEii/AbiGii toxin family protein [Phenylobacterium sp.]|nr:nucleotidyl transferase AbiEii/AbiGii toxin family protein [Phenylobacterium sp.]